MVYEGEDILSKLYKINQKHKKLIIACRKARKKEEKSNKI
jgi:hypothetical protein